MRYLPLVAALTLFPAVANAYPTSIVFAPTSEAKPLGQVGALAYTGVALNPSDR
jgi:hypothetical protein